MPAQSSFLKLSPARQRVAIAKDVLKRLDAKQYKPTLGSWVEVPSRQAKLVKHGESLQLYVKQRKPCTVCALGGIMASYAFFANQANFAEVGGLWRKAIGVHYARMAKRLLKVFDQRTLTSIEYIFERGGGAFTVSRTPEHFTYLNEAPLLAFIARHKTSRARFRAIFTNIVENKGEFIP